MSALERRCHRLAAVYPDDRRRAEVATTLIEANDGRRRPRAADALNVLWHGAATRLGRTPEPATRLGGWGDALSVTVVLWLLVYAATAVAIATAGLDLVPGYAEDPLGYPDHPLGWDRRDLLFTHDLELLAVALAAAVAVAAAVAACRGRVAAARALTALAALSAAAVVGVSHALGEYLSFRNVLGAAAVAPGLLLVGAVLGTHAVARAGRVVPRRWWGWAGGAAFGGALFAVHLGPHPFGHGRTSVVLASYFAAAGAVVAVAVPVVRRAPVAFAGAALAAVPVLPALPVMNAGYWTLGDIVTAAALGWTAALQLAALALRRCRAG